MIRVIVLLVFVSSLQVAQVFAACYSPCGPGQKHDSTTTFDGTTYSDSCINSNCKSGAAYRDDPCRSLPPSLPGANPSGSGTELPPDAGDPGDGTTAGGEGGYGNDDGGSACEGGYVCMPNKDGTCDDGYAVGTVDGFTTCVKGQSETDCPLGYSPASSQPTGRHLITNSGYCTPNEGGEVPPDSDSDGCPNNYTKTSSMPTDGRHFYRSDDGKYCIAGDGSLPEDKVGGDGLPRDKDGDGINDDGTEQGNPAEDDKDADGQPDESDEGPSASGGATCRVPPSCSGSSVDCALLLQQWKNRCADEQSELLAEEQNKLIKEGLLADEGRNELLGEISDKLDDNSTVSGGGDCNTPPVCEGNAVECAQLRQLWEQRCQSEGVTTEATPLDDSGFDPFGTSEFAEAKASLKATVENTMNTMKSSLGITPLQEGGTLPCFSIPLLDVTHTFCYSDFSFVFDTLAAVILILTSIRCYKIVLGRK